MVTTAPPPSALAAVAVPPCSSATRCTIASPRPEPGLAAGLVRAPEAVEDLRQVLLGEARAVVADRDPAAGDLDLDRAALGAPLGGVVEQVGDRATEPLAVAADQRGRDPLLEPSSAGAAPRALDGVAGELVEPDVLARRRRPRPARGPARPRRRPARSSPRARRSGRRPGDRARPGSSRSPRPSVSMLVRSVASGVRSSCEASATSRRWAASERSSASIISLKLAASRPSSSSPRTSIRRVRSWVRATSSAASETSPAGASAARATTGPSAAASATPPALTRNRIRTRSERVSSVSSSEVATCRAAPSASGWVSTRRGCRRRRRRPRSAAPAARGHLSGAGGDRDLDRAPGRRDHLAVGADDLAQRRRAAGIRRRQGEDLPVLTLPRRPVLPAAAPGPAAARRGRRSHRGSRSRRAARLDRLGEHALQPPSSSAWPRRSSSTWSRRLSRTST